MNQVAIFWPMLAQALLVFIVYLVLAQRRGSAVRTGEAKANQFKGRLDEPSGSMTAANNIMNQFELPVLFYVVCISLFATAGSSFLTVVLAWIFVATRYAHAYVHLTSNRIKWRNLCFRFGFVALLILWIVFALHIAGLI